MTMWYWMIAVAAVLLLVYEGIALYRHTQTISRLVWDASFRYPLVPFAFGLLMGHFFWQSGARCL